MDSDDEDQTVCRRPKDTKFKQQTLPAWQPVMTATNVLPFMFAIGVAFIPLGVAFLITSNNVQELMVDYTHCKSINGSETCAEILANNTGGTCICNVNFSLSTDFAAPVYVYYSLTNFYQNHRRYVKSRDDNQLLGRSQQNFNATSDCDGPFKGQNYTWYAPCGAIANSLFNDTLQIFHNGFPLTLDNTNIAWSTDRYSKFKNPPDFDEDEAGVFNNTLKPPNWPKPVYELNGNSTTNNGYENEDLMVWMRTAALPTFRKLYRRVVANGNYSQGLPAGNYTLRIIYNYPTVQFNGAKRMLITTMSWLGGKNPFLGIAYLVVGSISIVIGFVFLIIHLKVGKSSSDLHNIPLTPRTMYYDSCYAGSTTSNSH